MSGFVEDPDFEKAVKKQQTMRKTLLRAAEDICDLAGSLAAHDTGNYRRTLKATTTANGARAASHDIAGHLIEFGSTKNTAQAPLRRAADAVCDGFKTAPKGTK